MAVLTSEVSRQNLNKTSKNVVKGIRIAYMLFAMLFVCQGLYNTLIKVQQQNVNVRSAIKYLSKIKLPSITFCHKYKHGGKEAILNYNKQLFEKWTKSSKFQNCINM